MDEGSQAAERATVEETVREWLEGMGEERPRSYLGGRVREWSDLRGPLPWMDRYLLTTTIEHIGTARIDGDSASVEVRASLNYAFKRGTSTRTQSYDGLVTLERRDGLWLVCDHAIDGRRRTESIVIGPLAEQEHDGVLVRVLGFERTTSFTQFSVQLVNSTPDPVRLKHAYALVEDQAMWERLGFEASDTPSRESMTILLGSRHAVQLGETMLALALDVRCGMRRLPFRLSVPAAVPAELVAQPPPRRLPILRSSPLRGVLPWVAVMALLAWWGGWFAIIVPVVYLSLWYLTERINGRLPPRLDPGPVRV